MPPVHFRRLLLQTGFRLTQQASSIPPQGGSDETHVSFLHTKPARHLLPVQQSPFKPPQSGGPQGGWFLPPQSERRGAWVDFAVAIGVWVDASVAIRACAWVGAGCCAQATVPIASEERKATDVAARSFFESHLRGEHVCMTAAPELPVGSARCFLGARFGSPAQGD